MPPYARIKCRNSDADQVLKSSLDQCQFVYRLTYAGKGIVDGENIIGVPGFLVDDAGALTDDLRMLLFIGYSENRLLCICDMENDQKLLFVSSLTANQILLSAT